MKLEAEIKKHLDPHEKIVRILKLRKVDCCLTNKRIIIWQRLFLRFRINIVPIAFDEIVDIHQAKVFNLPLFLMGIVLIGFGVYSEMIPVSFLGAASIAIVWFMPMWSLRLGISNGRPFEIRGTKDEMQMVMELLEKEMRRQGINIR